MKKPLQISFRNTETSKAVAEAISQWVAKLEHHHRDIISCRVTVSSPSFRKRHGGLFHTRIDLRIPGRNLVINRQPDIHHSYVDVYVSLHDAFTNAERQLEEIIKRRQGEVKTHPVPPHGWIKSLVPEEDHGWIETADEREFYFHRNSLLNTDFDHLNIGAEVSFFEQPGETFDRASSVRLVGKNTRDELPPAA